MKNLLLIILVLPGCVVLDAIIDSHNRVISKRKEVLANEKAIQEAKEAEKRAIQEAKEAEEKAIQEAKEAEERAIQEAKEAEERAKQEAKKAELRTVKIAEKKKLHAVYRKEIRDVCSTEKWTTYEFGNYFATIAKDYRIEPYDLVGLDAYKTRNIPRELKEEIIDNIIRYLAFHFSDAMKAEQQSDNLINESSHTWNDEWVGNFADNPINKRKVFNEVTKKYNDCYNQLK